MIKIIKNKKEYDTLKFDFKNKTVTTKVNFKSEGWGVHVGPRFEKHFIYEYDGILGTFQHDGAFLSHFISLDKELLIPDLTEEERLKIPFVYEKEMWTPECNWIGESLPNNQHRFTRNGKQRTIITGDRFMVLKWYKNHIQ